MDLVATMLRYVLAFMLAYFLATWVAMAIWTFYDIRARSEDILVQLFSVLLVVVFNLFGLLLYLLLRPKETLAEAYALALEEESYLVELEKQLRCPSCNRRVEADYLLCPACHAPLKLRCARCNRLMELSWDVCAYCGTGVREAAQQRISP
jgi:RNA polymerase subunit RPABC4/transcription elongation factor Spt4